MHNTCWRSVKQFGHTFSEHGVGAKNTLRLTDRARGTGNPQRQWLDNQKAANYLSDLTLDEPASIQIPNRLGQVILPNGNIVSSNWAIAVPKSGGGLRTAYPIQ